MSPKLHAERISQIASKIKSLEQSFELRLDPSQWWLMRLDGCGFRSLTRSLEKPFDPRFTRAMSSVAQSLLDRFNALLAFTQSDEVTLAISNRDPVNAGHLWSGRSQKICSIVASFAAAKMTRALEAEGIPGKEPFFDCRVIGLPGPLDVAEAFWWRHAGDCRRNAVNMMGFAHFSHSSLEGIPLEGVLERLKRERGIDLDAWSDESLYGIWIKRKIIQHQGFNPRTQQHVLTTRRRVEARTGLNFMTPEEILGLLESETWDEKSQKSCKEQQQHNDQRLKENELQSNN